MFSWPSLHPVGDLNTSDMVMEMVNSARFLMGNDGRAQSKENKVLMEKQATVMGIHTWVRKAQLTGFTDLRAVTQDGDSRRSCRDLPWTRPAQLWLRVEEWAAER